MDPNPFLGVFLHFIGGIAAGSFYVPFCRVRRWSWLFLWGAIVVLILSTIVIGAGNNLAGE